VPNSIVLAQPVFQDSSGKAVGSGGFVAQVATGVSGTGIGKPQLAPKDAVLNAFSFTPGIAPGAMVSIFGENLADCEAGAAALPLPSTLCNASVTFGGAAGRLFYAGPFQINAEVPQSAAAGRDLPVVVSRGGASSDAFTVPASAVASVAPALAQYTLDGSTFRAVVQNPDNTITGPQHPLRPGEAAVAYANALGPTTPAVPDGEAAPQQPPAVTNLAVELYVNGFRQPVGFSGFSPGSSGLYQVNFKLDPATPLQPDDNNFIWLKVNGIESPHILLTIHQ
jgi:uncharacterized protein (TIGR03437 family)